MRIAARRAAAALLAAGLLLAGAAQAGDTAARAAAEASFARAEAAAKARHFAEAVAAYRAAIEADPSAPVAAPARARIEDLEAHAEGGFAPLARLDEVRRDPQKAGDRAAIEALTRDAEAFPPGRVRAEARVFVAEAWWHKLGDPVRAVTALEAAVSDPSGDRLTRSLALAELASLRRERGEIGAALRMAERDPTLSPSLLAQLRRLVRRERLRLGAEVVLAALVLVGAASIARLAMKARDVRDLPSQLVRPIGVAFALYLGGAGAVLVRVHGDADARPFVWLGLAVLALDVIARAFRLAAGRRALVRAVWAAACVAGVAAAAFLAVLWTSVDYLDGIGL
jgi:tetratricopeptide (TPR) repeat protein